MRTDPGTVCACQWGICGACDDTEDRGRPRHDRCLSRLHGHPVVYPLTWLTSKQGFVIGSKLWPADGPSCRYICPCPCAKTGPIESPTRRRPTAERPRLIAAPDPSPTFDPMAVGGALFELEAL